MEYSEYARNAMLDYLGDTLAAEYVSLHDGDPAGTGANEISGGSPAYARQAIAYDPANAGEKAQANPKPVFDVPAGTTVRYVGIWDAASGGNFLGATPVVDEVYALQGTYRLDETTLDLNLEP